MTGEKKRRACRQGWLKRCCCPTAKETELARKELMKKMGANPQAYVCHIIRSFAGGVIPVDATVIIGGRRLIFCGARKGREFPQAMVFYDPYRNVSVSFYGPVPSRVKVIEG